MTEIVNRGAPNLTVKKMLRAEIACPNCTCLMGLDADDVDLGHVVKCSSCDKNTYYPFERPWYRRRKLIAGYVLSILISFALGLLGNFVYDSAFRRDASAEAGTPQEATP